MISTNGKTSQGNERTDCLPINSSDPLFSADGVPIVEDRMTLRSGRQVEKIVPEVAPKQGTDLAHDPVNAISRNMTQNFGPGERPNSNRINSDSRGSHTTESDPQALESTVCDMRGDIRSQFAQRGTIDTNVGNVSRQENSQCEQPFRSDNSNVGFTNTCDARVQDGLLGNNTRRQSTYGPTHHEPMVDGRPFDPCGQRSLSGRFQDLDIQRNAYNPRNYSHDVRDNFGWSQGSMPFDSGVPTINYSDWRDRNVSHGENVFRPVVPPEPYGGYNQTGSYGSNHSYSPVNRNSGRRNYGPDSCGSRSRHDQSTLSKPSRFYFKPEKFSGRASDWVMFKNMFEMACQANQWSDAEQIYNLLSNITGEAQSYVTSLEHKPLSLTPSQWLRLLEDRFGRSRNPQHYRSMLSNKTWSNSQDPRAYADEIRRLISLAYQDCPSQYRETLLLQHFLVGVREADLQKHFRLNPPHSIDSAIEFMERWIDTEAISRSQASLSRPAHPIRMVAPYPDSDDEDSESEGSENDDELNEAVQFISRRFKDRKNKSFYKNHQKTFRSSGYSKPSGGSYDNNNHDKSSNSFRRYDRYSSNSRQLNEDERDWSKIECYHCGGCGHLKSECPSYKRIASSLNSNRPSRGVDEAKNQHKPQQK